MIRPYAVSPPDLVLRVERALFDIVWQLICRWTPRPAHVVRRMVLRAFGARIHKTAHIYPDARIWRPANLIMGAGSCLGPGVDCYCVADVTLGDRVIVSQGTYLCTASHDIRSESFDLVAAPIVIEEGSWVAARVIVLPGVTIASRCVIAAGSVVAHDTSPDSVWAGNPAKPVARR